MFGREKKRPEDRISYNRRCISDLEMRLSRLESALNKIEKLMPKPEPRFNKGDKVYGCVGVGEIIAMEYYSSEGEWEYVIDKGNGDIAYQFERNLNKC